MYTNDGLAVIHNANGPKLDRLRKEIISTLKSKGLCTTIDTNVVKTDFPDVTLRLRTGKYGRYNKPISVSLCTITTSQAFPSIAKPSHKIVNIKIIDLSYDENKFHSTNLIYESSLSLVDNKKLMSSLHGIYYMVYIIVSSSNRGSKRCDLCLTDNLKSSGNVCYLAHFLIGSK